MRVSSWKFFIVAAFVTNLLIVGLMFLQMDFECDCSSTHVKHLSYIRSSNQMHAKELAFINDTESEISGKIAIIIRDFEHFENDLPQTVASILTVLPSVKIFILSDEIPYPPLTFDDIYKPNIKIISLKLSLTNPTASSNVFNIIDNEHIFIFPDATRMSNITQLSEMLDLHYRNPNSIIAAKVDGSISKCLALNVSLRYWTMKYGNARQKSDCSALEGKHVLLLTKALLLHLIFPFVAPVSTSIFIQATLLKIKTVMHPGVVFRQGRHLFADPHLQWKHNVSLQKQKDVMYREFGIKKIVYPPARVEWHGCRKDTARCFGTVLSNMPEYLFQGRWTPPCCLEHLRQTTRYVFGILEKCGVRYWLEGGSLLGAVRTGDIIPWDYDVDIGIYRQDISKCEWLKNSLEQSIVDAQGFVWERAGEGDFIRVQYSRTNHLHVDIFPFYSKDGIMTKDAWFADHRQDVEFPERFLVPFYSIKFVGVMAAAPNNYTEFLELKFGKGVVQNPEYPDPKVMKFSRKKT